jgi:hypothetical protein
VQPLIRILQNARQHLVLVARADGAQLGVSLVHFWIQESENLISFGYYLSLVGPMMGCRTLRLQILHRLDLGVCVVADWTVESVDVAHSGTNMAICWVRGFEL